MQYLCCSCICTYSHQILEEGVRVCVCVCVYALCVIIGGGVVTGTQGLRVGHNKTVMNYSEHYWMASELKKLRSVYTYNMYVRVHM